MRNKQVELEGEIAVTAKRKTNRLEPLRNRISEANALEITVLRNSWLEMKNHLQKVGLNRQLRDQSLTVSFLNSWKSLAGTAIVVRNTAAGLGFTFPVEGAYLHHEVVEPRGFEPLTSSMPLRRSTN